MVTYYAFLWLVALLNGLRSIVQLLEGFSQEHLAIWNVLWLLTRCGGLAAVLCTSNVLRSTANRRLTCVQVLCFWRCLLWSSCCKATCLAGAR